MLYRCLVSRYLGPNYFFVEDWVKFLKSELEPFQKILPHPFSAICKLKVTTNKLSKLKSMEKLSVVAF